MAVTRDDVAKLAGVSPATVSYVINDGPRSVSPATRDKVLRAIEQLNYRPSAVARSLRMQRTQMIGIIVTDILNYVSAAIVKNAEDLLLPNNYSLTVCNSDESSERERAWLETLHSRRVDGIIALPAGSDNLDLMNSIMRAGTHITLIDRKLDGIDADCVLFDNESGAYQGVKHLIELGHTRIGLVNLPSRLTPGEGRLRGYMRAFQEAGLMMDPALVQEGKFSAEAGYAMAGELLDLTPRPTALFVSSNRLSQGVLRQVRERDLQMPNDLALCVFDDVPHFAYTMPSVSAISCDLKECVKRAIHFLCQRIDGEYSGKGRLSTISCQLKPRDSTLGA